MYSNEKIKKHTTSTDSNLKLRCIWYEFDLVYIYPVHQSRLSRFKLWSRFETNPDPPSLARRSYSVTNTRGMAAGGCGSAVLLENQREYEIIELWKKK